MKKLLYILTIMAFWGCEKVIDVEVPTQAPRLSIDALIRVNENDPFVNVNITASLTSSFFGTIQPADLSQIALFNLDATSPAENNIVLNETQPGVYSANVNSDFLREGQLVLFLTHEDQSYAALAQFVPAVPINKIVQGDDTLFTGEETEIMISFTDASDREDYYLFDFGIDEFLVTEDIFYQGQEFEFSYFFDDGIEPGTELEISLLGVDVAFYNYMNLLITQSGGSQGPFQTPVSTVRGNIINVTNVDINTINSIDDLQTIDDEDTRNNFALGYFSVSQTFTRSIVIE